MNGPIPSGVKLIATVPSVRKKVPDTFNVEFSKNSDDFFTVKFESTTTTNPWNFVVFSMRTSDGIWYVPLMQVYEVELNVGRGPQEGTSKK